MESQGNPWFEFLGPGFPVFGADKSYGGFAVKFQGDPGFILSGTLLGQKTFH